MHHSTFNQNRQARSVEWIESPDKWKSSQCSQLERFRQLKYYDRRGLLLMLSWCTNIGKQTPSFEQGLVWDHVSYDVTYSWETSFLSITTLVSTQQSWANKNWSNLARNHVTILPLLQIYHNVTILSSVCSKKLWEVKRSKIMLKLKLLFSIGCKHDWPDIKVAYRKTIFRKQDRIKKNDLYLFSFIVK